MSTSKHPTLGQVFYSKWKGDPKYEGLDAVVEAIAVGGRKVHEKIQAAALLDNLGSTHELNIQGEIVQKLDEAGSEIFVESLARSGRVAGIGSEELKELVVPGEIPDESYVVMTDPLDGSSNIDVAVSIGSIFGIWPKGSGKQVTGQSVLRPGNEQIAAVYIVYGSSTIMVVATIGDVQGFTLDVQTDEFKLTHPDIRFPGKCEYYSVNEGNFLGWDWETQESVKYLRETYSLRYVGSLVADFHRNLLKGGIFLYPADSLNRAGKLRLMYEANPLGFVAEQAGGVASTGTGRVLEVFPEGLHARTPLILGNKAVVNRLITGRR